MSLLTSEFGIFASWMVGKLSLLPNAFYIMKLPFCWSPPLDRKLIGEALAIRLDPTGARPSDDFKPSVLLPLLLSLLSRFALLY